MKTFVTFVLLGLALGLDDEKPLNHFINRYIDNLYSLKLQDMFDSIDDTFQNEFIQNIDDLETTLFLKFLGKTKEAKRPEVMDILAEVVEELNDNFLGRFRTGSFVADSLKAVKKK